MELLSIPLTRQSLFVNIPATGPWHYLDYLFSIGDGRHSVFDCPHVHALGLEHDSLRPNACDAMRSFLWHTTYGPEICLRFHAGYCQQGPDVMRAVLNDLCWLHRRSELPPPPVS